MGYLDGTSITVDAVLTKKGRETIKNGQPLNISSFTAADTAVDYTLWNADHPSGSAYYGEAIENLPMIEANVHAKYSMRNRLITLPQGTITIPAIVVQVPDSIDGNITFEDKDTSSIKKATVQLKGYAQSTANTSLYVIVEQPSVVVVGNTSGPVKELDGIMNNYVREAGINKALVYQIHPSNNSNVMWELNLSPDTTQTVAGRQTNLTIIEGNTGAYDTLTVTNNVTKLSRNLLGGLTAKGT